MRLMLVQRYVADKRVDEAQARVALQGFLDGLGGTLDQLKKAMESEEYDLLVRLSGVLRSQAAEHCVTEIADAAAALEMAAEAKSGVACSVHFDALARNAADIRQND
ncbi:MAG TPA: hypothetical protein PLD82_06255 [Spirochaetota bacterium]|nr:hypothetical protein [Spirochaetota bacterium]